MKIAFKIIKAFAIVLAIMIIVSVATWVVSGVRMFNGTNNSSQAELSEAKFDGIKQLDINVKATKLQIVEVETGDKLKIETRSEYIDQWEENGTLHIVERSQGIFGFNDASELTIYVRKDVDFEEVKLEAGAGTLDIANLRTKKMRLDLGAGKTLIEKLTVEEAAEVDGGAGLIEMRAGSIANLNLEVGAGKADLALKLMGDNRIQTGAGKLELDLLGDESDYQMEFKKGLGAVRVNGQDMSDGDKWGSGKIKVQIESGVGAAEINVAKE